MQTEWAEPVRYTLTLGEETVEVNDLIGHSIKLAYTGNIYCKICGRKTKKAFGEGFCYPHFMNAPENSPCIVRPELCEGHLGKGRDVEWEQVHHVQPHIVYLALSSGLKVGVTRKTQVPTRWIDQGATAGIRLAETPYRKLAGDIEVALKEYISDKTHWQRMLKGEVAKDILLPEEKTRMADLLPEELRQYVSRDEEIIWIHYPVSAYPSKVKSLKLDKVPEIQAKLEGIKGQYLIFEEGQVLNVRSHTGYEVELSA